MDTTKTRIYTILCEYYPLYDFKDRMECQFCATSLMNEWQKFKFSIGWFERCSLQQKTSLCKKYPSHFKAMSLDANEYSYTFQLHYNVGENSVIIKTHSNREM
jgi:hypothetical protein